MLSIVIPAFNCLSFTQQCIESIRKNTENYELIIIDNGSTDGTKEWLEKQNKFNCKLIEDDHEIFEIKDGVVCRFENNLGFAAGNNRGIALSSGDYLCCLSNDVIVTPNWADILLDHIEENRLDIVGPCTNFAAGLQRKVISQYHNEETLNKSSIEFTNQNKNKITVTNWVIGFCFVVSADNMEDIRGFDERFLIGNSEDIDLCFKAKALGLRIGIAEDCYLHHFGSQTFKEIENNNPGTYNKLLKSNHDRLVQKWGNEVNYNQI